MSPAMALSRRIARTFSSQVVLREANTAYIVRNALS